MNSPPLETPKKFRIALYGVLIRGSQVLMTETNTGTGTVIMNFPGGGLELGESPEESLVRELHEELGCEELTVGELLFATQHFHVSQFHPENHSFHVYYRMSADKERIRTSGNNDDVLSVQWVPLTALPRDRMTPIDREFADQVLAKMI